MAYNGKEIPVMGECEGNINYYVKNLNFKFIISNSKAAPILELDSNIKSNLMQFL